MKTRKTQFCSIYKELQLIITGRKISSFFPNYPIQDGRISFQDVELLACRKAWQELNKCSSIEVTVNPLFNRSLYNEVWIQRMGQPMPLQVTLPVQPLTAPASDDTPDSPGAAARALLRPLHSLVDSGAAHIAPLGYSDFFSQASRTGCPWTPSLHSPAAASCCQHDHRRLLLPLLCPLGLSTHPPPPPPPETLHWQLVRGERASMVTERVLWWLWPKESTVPRGYMSWNNSPVTRLCSGWRRAH